MTKSKDLYNVLVKLNKVCVRHKVLYKTYPPRVNLQINDYEHVNKEIHKLIKYLEYPQYSYLSK